MLSRVADSIYWMARYMERAENQARLLLANHTLLLDAGSPHSNEFEFWHPILMTTGDETGFDVIYGSFRGDFVEEFLSIRSENPNSIINCVKATRENARMIRDQISDEAWQCINSLYLYLTSLPENSMRGVDATAFYEKVIQGSFLFQGILRATMTREQAWRFLQAGTYLERADKTSRLVDTCSTLVSEDAASNRLAPLRWASLLHSCSAFHAFREISYELNPEKILQFLFLSKTFSRSVRFCLTEAEREMMMFKAPPGQPEMPDPLRSLGRLRASLEFTTIGEILSQGLHEYIDRLQDELNAVGASIFQTYVAYEEILPLASEPVMHQVSAGSWHASLQMAQQQQ
jgi:uncharacterized alpha-E superfamily protein